MGYSYWFCLCLIGGNLDRKDLDGALIFLHAELLLFFRVGGLGFTWVLCDLEGGGLGKLQDALGLRVGQDAQWGLGII